MREREREREREKINQWNIEYDQRDAAKTLKRFLTGQFVKFFLLIGLSI